MSFDILLYIGIVIIIIYFATPLVLFLFPGIFTRIIFLNYVYIPYFTTFDKPGRLNLNWKNWRNLKIKNNFSQIELGSWIILSENDEISDIDQLENDKFFEAFSNGRPIVLYLHGNSMHRGTKHRLELYHILRKSGYHILTVDYRGFGDSSGSIHNENEVLEDAFVTFNYIKSKAPNSPLFIWGHSLGTGISSLLLKKLSKIDDCSSVTGLILESPFTSVTETMDHIRLTLPWRCMPFFSRVFKQSLINQKLTFNSIENLQDINVPILILHAEDDKILSYRMGEKLYSTLKSMGKDITFKGFLFHYGYGHKHIIWYPELSNLIREFTDKAINR